MFIHTVMITNSLYIFYKDKEISFLSVVAFVIGLRRRGEWLQAVSVILCLEWIGSAMGPPLLIP